MNRISPFLAFAISALTGATLQARIDLLLVPPAEAISGASGTEFTLYLNNPTHVAETAQLPPEFVAEYANASHHGRVRLALVEPRDAQRTVAAMSRETIRLRITEPIPGAGGFVSLRLQSPATNAIMFELTGSAAPTPADATRTAEPAPAPFPALFNRDRDLDLSSDLEAMRRHLSDYEPIYFALGWRERLNARFQFSFKYRVFESGPPGEWWVRQLARDFHVGYTQTSIWDLESFSKPFYDSSYKPTAFILHEFDSTPREGLHFTLQFGGQHESNGKGGGAAPIYSPSGLITPATALRHPADSRSLNSLYVIPTVRWNAENGFFIEAHARHSAYFNKRENRDIARYRGYLELTVRHGFDRGAQLATHLRGSLRGHGSVELNLTWPVVHTPLLKYFFSPGFGGYAQVQYFNGYGESLLDYDVRRKDQLRFGIMANR